MNEKLQSLTAEQIKEAQVKALETKLAAEKVEMILRNSAASLLKAKESMIFALLEEKVDLHIISQSTHTPIERILELQAVLKK